MIDLHHHFDGAFEIEALYAEAKRRNLPQGNLPQAEFTKRCRVGKDCRTLTEFLAVFEFFYEIAQDLEFLHNQATRLPLRLQPQGVLYAETRFAPHLFATERFTAVDVVESVIAGLEKSNATTTRLILCVMRNVALGTVEELIMLYEKFHARGVCGIDLAGDESQYPCREYAPVFERAAAAGIPITIHAGEAAGPQSIYDALDLFHASRIGHGIRAIEDERLVRRLADLGIALEVCLTSNLQTGNTESYGLHPFDRLRRSGVRVTINTDDPSVSNIDLNHEWDVACREYGLSGVDRRQILLHAVDAAFCDAAMKANLRSQLEAIR